MRFERVKDIINHARHFHLLIADYYRSLSEADERPRLKMLLEYLEHHEKTIEKALAVYELDSSQKILMSWSKYSPCEGILKSLKQLLDMPYVSVDDVISHAIELDECLISMYKSLAANADTNSIRAVFDNLADMESQELRIVVRDAIRMKDI